MKLAALPVAIVIVFALLVTFSPSGFASTTTTTTIVGWLVPDGTHWNNGINAFLFPIIGVMLFVIMGRTMDLDGNIVATFALIGLVIGSVIGMLSLGNSTAGNALPFALPVVAGVDLVLWLWQGGKG